MSGRGLLVAVIGVSLAMPCAAIAQGSGKVARITTVIPGTVASAQRFYDAFVRGLGALGYVQGRNADLKVVYAEGNTARIPVLLREAVADRPDVIVTVGAAAARHAKAATSAIPVVVATASDLVEAGVVQSLARPGGNITGLSDLVDELVAKRLELTRELLPGASRIALLIDPAFPAARRMEDRARQVAASHRFELVPLYAASRDELTEVLRLLGAERVDALVAAGSALHATFARTIIDGARMSGVPVMHYWPGTAEAGALVSHGPNVFDNFRRAATFVDKILKGAMPADLPVEQPTTFELVVNLKTASSLGITIAEPLLLRADRIIQ